MGSLPQFPNPRNTFQPFENTERDELILRSIRNARSNSQGYTKSECPFCISRMGSAGKGASFSASMITGKFRCFRCGIFGRLNSIPSHLKMDAPESAGEDVDPPVDPPEGFIPLGSGSGRTAMVTRAARRYLTEKRHLPESLWEEAHLGVCLNGRFAGRVVIPVLSDDGKTWYGWVARSWMAKVSLKYLNHAGMKRAEMLFNHRALLEHSTEPVYVVEGVFDALALWPNAVALLGMPSRPQVQALIATRRPVAVVLDGDAMNDAVSLTAQLRAEGQTAGSVILPPSLDPDQVDPSTIHDAALRSLTEDWVRV